MYLDGAVGPTVGTLMSAAVLLVDTASDVVTPASATIIHSQPQRICPSRRRLQSPVVNVIFALR